MPKVSFLIPAHNAEKTLHETLNSLTQQTFRDFDILIVNDASTDNTVQVAHRYSPQLSIRVLTLEQNAGVAEALTRGLAHIDSEYIARLDADDIAHPKRLEMQVSYLDNKTEIDVCGSQIGFFSGDFTPGTVLRVLSHPTNNFAIKTGLIQNCAVVHGSALFRTGFFADLGGYDRRYDYAEDYDLWCRGALLGKNYANIPEILTYVRQHANQVSQQKAQLQHERDLAIKKKYISAILGGESPGLLPEFFSLRISFTSREIALNVLTQSMPLIMQLGQRIYDTKKYAEIVAGCIQRHLSQ